MDHKYGKSEGNVSKSEGGYNKSLGNDVPASRFVEDEQSHSKFSWCRFALGFTIGVLIVAIPFSTVSFVHAGYSKVAKNILTEEMSVVSESGVNLHGFEHAIILPYASKCEFAVPIKFKDSLEGEVDGNLKYILPKGDKLINMVMTNNIKKIEDVDGMVLGSFEICMNNVMKTMTALELHKSNYVLPSNMLLKELNSSERLNELGVVVEMCELKTFKYSDLFIKAVDAETGTEDLENVPYKKELIF